MPTLRLTVRSGHGPDRDVVVELPDDADVKSLAAAIGRHVGGGEADRLYSARLGPLEPARPVASTGLRDGDVVGLGPLPRAASETVGGAAQAVSELIVSGGPAAGRRIALVPGQHVVGRDPEHADIAIDDPSMSRRHVELRVGADGAVAISDAGSRNGTSVEGTALATEEVRPVGLGEHVEAGRSLLAFLPWRAADPTTIDPRGFRLAFNRPPRVARPFDPPILRIDSPPSPIRRGRLPLAAAIIPVFGGVMMWVVLKSPYMLMMAALSPMMMVGTYVSDRRGGRKDHAERVAAFEHDAASLEADLDAARRAELAERRAAAPDAGELVARARRRLPELWERRPSDRDFLDVRVGVADQPALVTVQFASGGDPALRERVEKTIARHGVLPAVPVPVNLAGVGALGLAGGGEVCESLARWIVVQLATLTSPRDVVVAAALSPERSERWSWLGWLPHVTSPGSPLDGSHVAIGTEATRELMAKVAAVAEERRDDDQTAGRTRPGRRATIVLLVDDEVAPEPTVVDQLLERCAEVDIVAIWLASEARDLPGGCGAIVELARGRAVGEVVWAATGQRIPDASIDGVALNTAESVARALAPVQDVTAEGAAVSIPRSVPLVELLGLVEPTSTQIRERWARNASDGLPATLGLAAAGPLVVDLRADGPHALVAGTTGAGKSELLQSLIVSLAAVHPPDRLTFLLVDYKGGAAFKDCVRLPHSVGMVTDLDEHEVRRALVSLEAELKRRERVLHAAQAKDLASLESRDPGAAPASLAIVIDEFATLAREVPAFVDGVVDVAQRGRSLGVHLVLATQHPGNVVTANIRANTNLRIALRVAGRDESEDVIGSPAAARLARSVPGRALARTGPKELTEFQAGYVGGVTSVPKSEGAIAVRELRFGVPLAQGAPHAPAADSTDETTDLQLLVRAIGKAADDAGIPRPPSPWLPALPDVVTPADVRALNGGRPAGDASVAIGIVDEPRGQRRVPLVFDFERDGNLLIYGGPGSGKTAALRSIATTLARQVPPSSVHMYGLDFAGRGLAALEALPHCGAVVFGEDDERVGRLLGMLRRTIDERKRALVARGALTLEEYRAAAPAEAMARIVILLDSYAGFVDAYEKVDLGALVDAVPRLVADGRTAGVHFVITGDRRMAIPQAVASIVSRRLVLRMANEDEYAMLGLDPREVKGAELPPGRGFLDDGREAQVAVIADEVASGSESAVLQTLGSTLLAEHPGTEAPPVPRMPAEISRSALPTHSHALSAVIGVDDLDLSPVEFHLEDGHALVVGPYRSGRTTALETIVRSLRDHPAVTEMHLLMTRRSRLAALDGWTSVARDSDACDERLPNLVDLLYQRSGEASEEPIVVVIDDAGELAEARCAGALEALLKRGRDRNVHVIASMETGQARHWAPWIREIRKDGVGILLDPNTELDGDLFGVRLPRRTNQHFPPGRGYAVVGGLPRLVQIASAE